MGGAPIQMGDPTKLTTKPKNEQEGRSKYGKTSSKEQEKRQESSKKRRGLGPGQTPYFTWAEPNDNLGRLE